MINVAMNCGNSYVPPEEINKMTINKDTEKYLNDNTWASIKLKDVPNKTRLALIKMLGDKVYDMVEQSNVIVALEIEQTK